MTLLHLLDLLFQSVDLFDFLLQLLLTLGVTISFESLYGGLQFFDLLRLEDHVLLLLRTFLSHQFVLRLERVNLFVEVGDSLLLLLAGKLFLLIGEVPLLLAELVDSLIVPLLVITTILGKPILRFFHSLLELLLPRQEVLLALLDEQQLLLFFAHLYQAIALLTSLFSL